MEIYPFNGVPCPNSLPMFRQQYDEDNDGIIDPSHGGTGVANFTPMGVTGYRTKALAAANLTLVADTDVIYQNITGTLTSPISLIGSVVAVPTAGKVFNIYFNSLVIDITNTLTIKSGSTTLASFTEAGTLLGNLILVSTGAAWVIQGNNVQVIS